MSTPTTLTMTKGLPGSGKTTWARAEQDAAPDVVLVCKDELRALLHGGRYSPDNEMQVLAVRDAVVVDSLARHRHVIVHDTNLHASHEATLRALAHAHRARFVVRDFTDVPLEVCIARDAARPRPVGANVIRDMWRQFLQVPPEPPVPGAPEA